MEETRKTYIVAAILLVAPIIACSSENESQFQREYVERLTSSLCETPEYLGCLGVSNSKCVASIYSASLKCDISEFEKSVGQDDMSIMEEAAIEYLLCISDHFVSIANIDDKQWADCESPAATPMPNKSLNQDAQ